MKSLRKIAVILFLGVLIGISLILCSCDSSESDGGIIYDGTTVIGADTDATVLSIREGTTKIASGAFSDCKSLVELTIPSSVKEIEAGAFTGATSLVSQKDGIEYVDNWAVGCLDVTEIKPRVGTVGIANSAFEGAANATVAIVPDSVKHIGTRSFAYCTSLTSITLPFVGESADSTFNTHFSYIFGASTHDNSELYVPSSLTSITVTAEDEIRDYAFAGCRNISNVTLPQTLVSIGEHAFDSCASLSRAIIPNSVRRIGSHAFYKCVALAEVTLPENEEFTLIDEYTFAYCANIRSLTIPASVTEIRACAIARCEMLSSLTVSSERLSYIGQQAFDGCKQLTTVSINADTIAKGAFKDCQRLGSVTLGADTSIISEYAFSGCTSLTEFTIPENVIALGESAFEGCSALARVIIPNGRITRIEKRTFYACPALTDISIPDSVRSIGEDAFLGCFRIESTKDGVTYIDGWITDALPSVITPVILCSVRGILDEAFSDCKSITTVYYEGTEAEWLALIERSANTELKYAALEYLFNAQTTN